MTVTAFPDRDDLVGTPTTGTFKTALGDLYDALKALLDDTGEAADARAALGALGAAQSGFRNLIINGNFNVNQRVYASGTATTAANQYTFDRWYVDTSGDSVTFAASGNGNEITIGSGVNFSQKIAAENILGGTYTLSWTGTATATVGGTAVDNGGNVTLTANTQATITFTDGTLSQVQLEPGDTQTDFEQRPKSAELALCLPYFERLIGKTSAAFCTGLSRTTTDFRGAIAYSQKRANPSISFSDLSTFQVQLGNGSNATPSAFTLAGESPTRATLVATVTGATVGQGAILLATGSSGAYFAVDAEL